MKVKLFNYSQQDTFIHRLSGVTKLICFLLLTSAAMFTYDYRVIGVILVFSFIMVGCGKLSLKKLKPMLIYVAVFLIFNFVLTFIITPYYGCQLYESKTVILHLFGNYDLTKEQLLYQATKTMKYLSAIPLGFVFFLTTNPSEFASSLNGVGVSYKICTSLSLTLRYFPDIQKDYTDISCAQQARGLDNSKKANLKQRVVNTTKIIIPLVFSTLDRVEMISNAMDLRGYSKHNKKTWYSYKPLGRNDFIAIIISIIFLVASLYMRFVVTKSMYYNPFN